MRIPDERTGDSWTPAFGTGPRQKLNSTGGTLRPCQCLNPKYPDPKSGLLSQLAALCPALAGGAYLQRRPGADPMRFSEPLAAHALACAQPPGARGRTPPKGPPPGPFGFESPAGCARKRQGLSPAWRVRPPVPGAPCKSSVPVGSGNAPALPGSCWRPSGATRNSWGWWPRCKPVSRRGRGPQGVGRAC